MSGENPEVSLVMEEDVAGNARPNPPANTDNKPVSKEVITVNYKKIDNFFIDLVPENCNSAFTDLQLRGILAAMQLAHYFLNNAIGRAIAQKVTKLIQPGQQSPPKLTYNGYKRYLFQRTPELDVIADEVLSSAVWLYSCNNPAAYDVWLDRIKNLAAKTATINKANYLRLTDALSYIYFNFLQDSARKIDMDNLDTTNNYMLLVAKRALDKADSRFVIPDPEKTIQKMIIDSLKAIIQKHVKNTEVFDAIENHLNVLRIIRSDRKELRSEAEAAKDKYLTDVETRNNRIANYLGHSLFIQTKDNKIERQKTYTGNIIDYLVYHLKHEIIPTINPSLRKSISREEIDKIVNEFRLFKTTSFEFSNDLAAVKEEYQSNNL